jgi:hypothetical protein
MTNIFITLDYELFFGKNPGTQYNSIIKPTNKLLEVLNKFNIKASFFVDSGYLIKLKEYKDKFPKLEKDFEEIKMQLEKLSLEGHDIQLHIHPHWEDSIYNGEKWIIDTTRYRLDFFTEIEIDSIVEKYTNILKEFTKNEIFTFRAGGWCIQPFEKLNNAFKKNNICLDSTIYLNGKNNSHTHFFNFKNSPNKSYWRFDKDPLIEDGNGYFHEIPIASLKVSPLFFWKLVWMKKNKQKKHKNFGDGTPAGAFKWDKIRMLSTYSNTVVSIDGYKASLLNKSLKLFKRKTDNFSNFVIIGHPKSLTEYSLEKLDEFIEQNKTNTSFITYSNWKKNNLNIINI